MYCIHPWNPSNGKLTKEQSLKSSKSALYIRTHVCANWIALGRQWGESNLWLFSLVVPFTLLHVHMASVLFSDPSIQIHVFVNHYPSRKVDTDFVPLFSHLTEVCGWDDVRQSFRIHVKMEQSRPCFVTHDSLDLTYTVHHMS